MVTVPRWRDGEQEVAGELQIMEPLGTGMKVKIKNRSNLDQGSSNETLYNHSRG